MITDQRSSIAEKLRKPDGNEIESKRVQFPDRGAPDRINWGAGGGEG